MGETFTEITLKNSRDVGNARSRLIKKAEVRQMTLLIMADTGSTELIINEKMRKQLGLRIEESDIILLANNQAQKCHYTEPVTVYWKDRRATCNPVVMPGNGEALLGVIPLESLDLIVDPVDQQVVGKHGDTVVKKAVSVRRR
jgi:predicted aspartyl protease